MDYNHQYRPLRIDFAKFSYNSSAQMIIDASLMRNPRRRWSIADIRRLPTFHAFRRTTPKQQADQKLMPPPSKNSVDKKEKKSNENKKNLQVADGKSRRETTYDSFIKPLIDTYSEKLVPRAAKRPVKVLQNLKVQSDNVSKSPSATRNIR